MSGSFTVSQQPSNTLSIGLDFGAGSIDAWLPDEANNLQRGKWPLAIDEQVGLPAILKLLNRDDFRARDYYPDEVAFLRDHRYVVDGLNADGTPAISRDTRRKLGMALFDSLFSTEDMRRVFENMYRTRDSLHVQLS